MTRFLAGLALVTFMAAPAAAASNTWTGVYLMPSMCSNEGEAPENHEKACALSCAKSGGLGVVAEGKFLKFDANGTQLAVKALESTKQTKGIKVTVAGDLTGDTIKVSSLKLVE
jgi:hypothetical protein